MTCEEVRIALGAHALGALDPEEALEIDHHLATCEACGAELMELEGVSAFLGKVSERDVELVASPPRQVLDRLLNDRARRNRRGRILMSVAASAAVLVVGGTVWTAIQTRPAPESAAAGAPAAARSSEPASDAPRMLQDDSSAERAAPAESVQPRKAKPSASATGQSESDVAPYGAATPKPSASPMPSRKAVENGREFTGADRAAGYRATVLAWPTAKGTELGVRVSGVPVETSCALVVVGLDGRRETTMDWVVSRESYQDKAVFRSETTMSVREIARFEIVDRKGERLVVVPVPDKARE
ncbi:putative zinc finger protein [Nonomuraea fuscirosea]|uniref:Putative zinc finger protein n=1 Tax=Nonomuraea fuscirosea TaxID=1291556 RepID=A0A2T0MWA5_9ACTN|nr:zf-HC2 domain-containing protein [Nonomuraea fuscirosea]PRX63232.1 putative zinc finger protein [Nonomuraea fuscirosea]